MDDTHGILVDAMKIIPMVVWAPDSVLNCGRRQVRGVALVGASRALSQALMYRAENLEGSLRKRLVARQFRLIRASLQLGASERLTAARDCQCP